MDGKKKLEELVAGLDGVTPGPWQLVGWKPCGIYGKGGLADAPRIARIDDRAEHDRDAAHIARCDPDTIRSISDAYKAMEAENERLRRAVEFTAKMCWRTDPPHAVNALSVVDRLSAIKFHPTIKKYGEPHEQLRVAESEASHEG